MHDLLDSNHHPSVRPSQLIRSHFLPHRQPVKPLTTGSLMEENTHSCGVSATQTGSLCGTSEPAPSTFAREVIIISEKTRAEPNTNQNTGRGRPPADLRPKASPGPTTCRQVPGTEAPLPASVSLSAPSTAPIPPPMSMNPTRWTAPSNTPSITARQPRCERLCPRTITGTRGGRRPPRPWQQVRPDPASPAVSPRSPARADTPARRRAGARTRGAARGSLALGASVRPAAPLSAGNAPRTRRRGAGGGHHLSARGRGRPPRERALRPPVRPPARLAPGPSAPPGPPRPPAPLPRRAPGLATRTPG